MTRDEIDTLWRKALIASVCDDEPYMRYHFAELVAKTEREACAKVCEELQHNLDHASKEWSHADLWDVAEACAETIRARGEA